MGDFEELNQSRSLISSPQVAYMLLLLGAATLVLSIIFSASVPAFIGLGLVLWGSLLLFVRPRKYLQTRIMTSTVLSQLALIDSIILSMKCEGKAVYLPPKFMKALKGGMVFISLSDRLVVPEAEKVMNAHFFLDDPKGIVIPAPGLDLANLYEAELGRNFAKVDISYLQDNLPVLFVEDLEIAQGFEIDIEGDKIKATLIGSVYNDLWRQIRKLSNTGKSIGCPLCSSLAVAFTRVLGKPIVINDIDLSQDEKTMFVNYQIVEG